MSDCDIDLEKAKILTQEFNIYGIGNFDLTLSEIAYILGILTLNDLAMIDFKLKELYNDLSKTRLG